MLAYARVSSDRQQEQGTSLEAQRERFARWCREHSYPAPLLYVEAESAGEGKREARDEYNRLLSEARPGDLVLSLVVDRWTRDVVDGVATVRQLLASGCGWVAVDEEIDARTEHGYDQLLQRAAGAEIERRRIRRRTVGARQRLRAMGLHVEGLPPLGYRVEKRRLVVDPAGAALVRRMFALCIAGRSCREIGAELDIGAHTNVARRLRDRRYLGETNTQGSKRHQRPVGEWIPGTHEALVDRATFDAAQAALAARQMGGRPPSGDSAVAGFLLRGLARCAGCGYVMRAQKATGGVHHAGWYACVRCGGPYARQDEVDAEAEQKLLEHLERERERLRAPAPPPKPQPDTAARRRRLAGQIDRLVSALADGTLRPEEARPRLEKARADLAALEGAAAPAAPVADRGKALATVEGIREAWAGLAVDERREALRLLAERVEIARDGERWGRGAWRLRIRWKLPA